VGRQTVPKVGRTGHRSLDSDLKLFLPKSKRAIPLSHGVAPGCHKSPKFTTSIPRRPLLSSEFRGIFPGSLSLCKRAYSNSMSRSRLGRAPRQVCTARAVLVGGPPAGRRGPSAAAGRARSVGCGRGTPGSDNVSDRSDCLYSRGRFSRTMTVSLSDLTRPPGPGGGESDGRSLTQSDLTVSCQGGQTGPRSPSESMKHSLYGLRGCVHSTQS
jgi:hypothetical protein